MSKLGAVVDLARRRAAEKAAEVTLLRYLADQVERLSRENAALKKKLREVTRTALKEPTGARPPAEAPNFAHELSQILAVELPEAEESQLTEYAFQGSDLDLTGEKP